MGGTHFDLGKGQATTNLEEDGGGIDMTADGGELGIHLSVTLPGNYRVLSKNYPISYHLL